MYDADVGRFLSLDPLAADFPSWSDYNYVLGNPVIFVDPDGKDTAYYSESGKLLHYSYDDAENAVTIVPNKKLAHFLYLTGGYENSSLTIESTRELRSLGVSYIMKVLLSFDSEYRTNTKSCYLQNTYDLSLEEIIYVIYPDGSRMEGGVFAEHGMILYASQDRLTVSTGGKAYTNKRPEFNFLYPLAGDDNYVGNVHLHPDVGEYKFQTRESSTVGRIYTKIIKSMATKGDQDAKNDSEALNGNGFYNIAIDDKHLHFYNGNTQFKVEKNIFDE